MKEEKKMMRRNMKRMMAAALVGVMTASLALTGCGGKDKKKSDSGEKVITVWSWDVALMQLQEAAEEYQKDYLSPQVPRWEVPEGSPGCKVRV